MRWKHLSRLESGALTVRRVQLMRMMSRISEVSAGGEDGGDVHELAGAERGPSAVRRRSSQGRDMWGAEVPNQPDWHLTRPARAVLTVGVRRGAPQTVDASGNVSQSMIIHEDESRPETAASADTGDLERLERRGSTSLERRGSSAPFGRLPAYASGGGRPGTASEFGRHAGPGIPEEQGEGEGEGEGSRPVEGRRQALLDLGLRRAPRLRAGLQAAGPGAARPPFASAGQAATAGPPPRHVLHATPVRPRA